MDAMKTIVAAVDFSDATAEVLGHAVALSKAFGAEVHLIHAVEPEPIYEAYGMTPADLPALHVYHEEIKRRANSRLSEIAAKFFPEAPPTLLLAEGSAVYSILEYLEKSKADLVVVGTHGHGAVASLLLGSVADALVRKSTTPVLVIPIRDKK
jgi:nucleotide-binding universal stress UspA family protein